MKPHYLILIAFLLSTSFLSCEKKPTTIKSDLPEATQTGVGTFGCYINGKPYVTSGSKGSWSGNEAYFLKVVYSSDTCLDIVTSKGDPNSDFSIGIKFKNMMTLDYEVGYYHNIAFRGHYADYSNTTVPSGSNTFKTDSTHLLKIHFTKFTNFSAGGILCGSFNGTMVNSDGTAIQISDGRFDLTWGL